MGACLALRGVGGEVEWWRVVGGTGCAWGVVEVCRWGGGGWGGVVLLNGLKAVIAAISPKRWEHQSCQNVLSSGLPRFCFPLFHAHPLCVCAGWLSGSHGPSASLKSL